MVDTCDVDTHAIRQVCCIFGLNVGLSDRTAAARCLTHVSRAFCLGNLNIESRPATSFTVQILQTVHFNISYSALRVCN